MSVDHAVDVVAECRQLYEQHVKEELLKRSETAASVEGTDNSRCHKWNSDEMNLFVTAAASYRQLLFAPTVINTHSDAFGTYSNTVCTQSDAPTVTQAHNDSPTDTITVNTAPLLLYYTHCHY